MACAKGRATAACALASLIERSVEEARGNTIPASSLLLSGKPQGLPFLKSMFATMWGWTMWEYCGACRQHLLNESKPQEENVCAPPSPGTTTPGHGKRRMMATHVKPHKAAPKLTLVARCGFGFKHLNFVLLRQQKKHAMKGESLDTAPSLPAKGFDRNTYLTPKSQEPVLEELFLA